MIEIFNINRKRAWQIVKSTGEKASLNKRIWPHLLRHSDAIERLRQTTFVTAIRAVVAKVCLIMFGVTVLVILALFAVGF